MNDNPNPYHGLPSWPKEAKDLPDDKVPSERYRLLYLLGVIGLLGGFALGFMVDGGLGAALGHGTILGFVGVVVGYLMDRARWIKQRQPKD